MQEELIRLAKNVWLWPHHPDPNRIQPSIGIIVGEDETTLIDSGNSPRTSGQVRDALKRADLPAVSRIIYTHHHWDHIWGACEFQVPIVAHSACRSLLTDEAKKPWGPEFLQREIRRNPKLRVSYRARERAIQNWETFRIMVPDVVFESNKTISLSRVRIELEYVGGQHAEDSIVVKVPEARVMFLGDCYYPPPLHLRTPDSTFSVSMLASLVDEAYDLYVESHDVPLTRGEILEFLEES